MCPERQYATALIHYNQRSILYELFKTQDTLVPQKTAHIVVMATYIPTPWYFKYQEWRSNSNQLYALSGKTSIS